MSCFRLPKTVITKLTSAVAKYWWSSDRISRGLHWMSWNKLCGSKVDGGMGFRNMDDFNTVLLAKQLWRLISAPESLFAKVFKRRYYGNGNLLEEIRSYSPSYGWRSIISARLLVNKRLIKRVGSGSSILVWSDPWIAALCSRPATSNGSPSDQLLRVNQLIDSETNRWNMERLRSLVDSNDVAIICGLPLGPPHKEDKMGCHYTKTGKYTVKSGYHVLQSQKQVGNGILFLGPDTRPLKAYTWKVKCPPKLKHFLWQILSGCVSVSYRLQRRRISYDPGCIRCGKSAETINHALFQCLQALQAWALSQILNPDGMFPANSVYTNMDYLIWRTPKAIDSSMFPWLLWYIWKARNSKMYENIDMDPREVVKLAESEADAWNLAQQQEEHPIPWGLGNHQDTSPVLSIDNSTNPGVTRCWIDGSWKDSAEFSGLGWWCLLADGETQHMGATNLRRCLTPLHAEVESLVWAMRCMIGYDVQNVVFLIDCSELVKMVSSPKEWPAFEAYL